MDGWPTDTIVRRLCFNMRYPATAAMSRYVAVSLGPQFTEAPPSSLADIYKDSSPVTPIIFILSQGTNQHHLHTGLDK
jgi:hypothetical protein